MYKKLNSAFTFFFMAMTSLLVVSCSVSKKAADGKDGVDGYGKLEKSLLWKIEGNDIAAPSYLYGTIHMINAEDYFLPDGTLSALDASDQMVFEIDMNEMNDMSAIMGIMGQAFMKDGKTLSDLLSAEDYQLVSDHFKKIGLPLMMLERIKPAFLSVFAADMDPQGMQNGSIKSYEMEFFKMAEETSKPVAGLETIEYQMSVFDQIPYEDQAQMLIDAIKSGDSGADQFKQMVEIYKAQDIQGMISMFEEDETMSSGNNNDLLLVQRNKNWIPIMSEMMKTQKVFFAVGAGHLAGKDGVIHLLRKAGYKLTPMNTKG